MARGARDVRGKIELVWLRRRLPSVALVAIGACGDAPPPPQPTPNNCEDPPRGPAMAQFTDVTAASGIDFQYEASDFTGGALAVADLDGDGLPDIVASRQLGGLAVFRNRGSLHFEQVTDSGLDPTFAASAIAAVDLDNDLGDIDLVIAGAGTAYVMANLGNGTFTQVAKFDDSGTTQHVLPVDLDGDGLLDLYFSNHDLSNPGNTNRLYLNRGGLQFAFGGAVGAGQAWSATALDVDGDGDQDLYIANDTLLADFGSSAENELPVGAVDLLLRNDGPGPDGIPHFTDIAADMGLAQPRSSMGGLLADFNDDELLDIYIPNFGAKKVFVREPRPQLRARAMAAFGGGYIDDAVELGLAAIGRLTPDCTPPTTEACLLLSWSAAVSDFDLDGYDELLVVNGVSVSPAPPPPVLMFTSGPSLPYTEVSPDIACMDARGLVVTDLDGDGDQDIIIGQQTGPLVIYEDRGTPEPTTWLRAILHGSASNRQGIGAVLTLHMTSGRTQTRAIGAGGVLDTSSPAEGFSGSGPMPSRASTCSGHPVDKPR